MKTANMVREIILPGVLLVVAFYSSTGNTAGRDTGHSPYNAQRLKLSHCISAGISSTDQSRCLAEGEANVTQSNSDQAYDWAALQVYVNQGMWPELIQADSELSGSNQTRQSFNTPRSAVELQGMDSLSYAYLQSAQDGKAQQILQAVLDVEVDASANADTAYYLAAIPARLAVEQQDWRQASQLGLGGQQTQLLQAYPQHESILVFVRALGAARSGEVDTAKLEMRRLNQLYQAVKRDGQRVWRDQLAMQLLAAQAWTQQAQGHEAAALDLMQKAVSTELNMGGQANARNQVVPMGELLGDLLLEQGQLAAAKDAYVQTLHASRNRFNSLYGAAYTAEHLGDMETAESYYIQLLSQARDAESDRPSLQHARDFMAHGNDTGLSFSVTKS